MQLMELSISKLKENKWKGKGSIIQATTKRGSGLGLTGLLVETKENTLRSQRPVAPLAC